MTVDRWSWVFTADRVSINGTASVKLIECLSVNGAGSVQLIVCRQVTLVLCS